MIQLHLALAIVALLFSEGSVQASSPADGAEEQRSEAALEILAQAGEVVRSVQTVEYEISGVPGGVSDGFLAPTHGTGILARRPGEMPKFLLDLYTDRQDAAADHHLTLGFNGETYFLIDHRTKKAYEDFDPAVMGLGGRARFVTMIPEFVLDAPFDDELNAKQVRLVGSREVEGEDCHEIFVVYEGDQAQATWFFSKSDHLPRGKTRHFVIPEGGKGSVAMTLSAVRVNPEVSESAFRLTVPDGYEMVNDFAP